MLKTYFASLQILASTPAFKKKAAQIVMVATAAVVGAIVANKIDPAEIVETVSVETVKAG